MTKGKKISLIITSYFIIMGIAWTGFFIFDLIGGLFK